MEIKRIGRNPSADKSRSRASQISVHNGMAYFAATPDQPFDAGASVAVQTQQLLKRVDERLASAGSDKSRILMAHIILSDMRFFAEMNAVWMRGSIRRARQRAPAPPAILRAPT
jgi:enamine deaminase RidA (YjgF/YER057c/UK114 family)